MSNQICLPKSHIIIIFCFFIGLSAWYIHNDKKNNLDDVNLDAEQTRALEHLESVFHVPGDQPGIVEGQFDNA